MKSPCCTSAIIDRQRIGKHVLTETNTHETIEDLLEAEEETQFPNT
jgi:hypothetical protein